MWNLTSLRAARACRKLGRVATRVCSAVSQPVSMNENGPGRPGPLLSSASLVADGSVEVVAHAVDGGVVLVRKELLGET